MLLLEDLLYCSQASSGFRLDTSAASTALCEYVKNPSESVVLDCEAALLKLQAYSVLQAFFRNPIYFNYLNAYPMIRSHVLEKITSHVLSQPYTTDELSTLYGITSKTFLKWIAPFKEKIGEKVGWYFNVRQVNVIFENLGRPEKVTN